MAINPFAGLCEKREPGILVVGDAIELEIREGQRALIDVTDWERELRYSSRLGHEAVFRPSGLRWHITRTGYVAWSKFLQPRFDVYLHRLVIEAPAERFVDHINGNRLDCRRANLRLCTFQENTRNRRGNTGARSLFKGVFWENDRAKWSARITIDGRSKKLGRFCDEVEAAKAYDAAARLHYGEFARPNFAEV